MDNAFAEKEARRYLRSGRNGTLDETELAGACDRVIQATARRSFKRAIQQASRFLQFTSSSNGPLRLSATRCLARYKHLSGEHRDALALYLKARELASGDAITRARIDRVLTDVYMYLGDLRNARRAASRATAAFTRAGAKRDLAQTQSNYGNLLHRLDRHRDAERIYRQAAAYFERSGDSVSLARCLYNRANTLVQLFEIEEAERLYRRAREIYVEAGFELDACDVSYGLAWLWMLTGRFHKALLQLARCQDQYHDGGDRRGEALCILDRAETFLALGLCDDALGAARTAYRRFTRLGLRYEQSKAALFRAQAAFALGKKAEALKATNDAQAGFRDERNDGFCGAVKLLSLEIGRDGQLSRRDLKSVQTYLRRGQLSYWAAIGDLKAVLLHPKDKTARQRLSKNAAVQYVPHLYALWQTLEGDTHYQQHRRKKACRHWQQAADRLDTVKSQLPPVELRSSYSRAHDRPHDRLVRAHLRTDPLWSAVWSERSRTAGLWAPIAKDRKCVGKREKVEESLTALARHVAHLSREISSGSRASSASGSAPARLQKRIREHLLEFEQQEQALELSNEVLAEQILQRSHVMPVMQFHLSGDDIIAFVHVNGLTRVVSYRGGRQRLRTAFQRWRFFLDRELVLGDKQNSTSLSSENALWSDLGTWLWKPLEVGPDRSRVLILPEGELANLPWGALISDSRALAESHSFVLSPSIRHHLAARAVRVRSRCVNVFRGRSDGLPATETETAALMTRSGSDATMHYPCRRDDWPESGSSHIWHFSGHAVVREDNPFYSFLALDDGPLFAADFRLRSCRVNLVTLAACRSGEHFAVPGEEATGLVRSLLEMGARNVVAGYWPLADESTSLWMRSFYDRFFGGDDILESARQAALTVRETHPGSYYWAAFSVTGAGDIGGSHVS